MPYTEQTWHDLPTQDSPINAARLTHIEDGVAAATTTADAAIPGLQKGAANGVAALDGNTKVPTGQIPDLSGSYDPIGAASAAQGAAIAASLQKSANLADVASASSSRTNLGLGTAATQASSAFDASGAAAAAVASSAQRASNLADLASASTARSNLGLGNIATHPASDFVAHDAWRFNVADYGAAGDGKVISDGAMTSASGVLTAASGPFVSGDVGKPILVAGAGSAAGRVTLVTTIASYQSSTQVTLTAVAVATVSNAWAVYGTDDTAAINSAVATAYAWWQANNYRQPVILLPAIYMIAGAPTQGGATKGNAQIPLPVPPMAGQRFEPRFVGQPDVPSIPYGLNSAPAITGGALVCARTDGTNHITYGPAAVIGSWTRQQGAGDGVMANLRPILDGLTIVLPYGSTYCGIDLYGCTGAVIPSSVSVIGWASPTQAANPNAGDFVGRTWVFGLRTPVTSNDGQSHLNRYSAFGLMIGIQFGEHVYAADIVCFFCYYGLQPYSDGGGSPMVHASHISYACVEACYYQLAYIDAGIKLDIACLDVDNGAGGSGFQILDAGNAGRGDIRVRGLGATKGKPAVSGGSFLRVINADQVPGVGGITQPAVVAASTDFKNDYYRDAMVTVAGGTGVAVSVAGQATGLATGAFMVPSGQAINLGAYSVAPTWAWVLL